MSPERASRLPLVTKISRYSSPGLRPLGTSFDLAASGMGPVSSSLTAISTCASAPYSALLSPVPTAVGATSVLGPTMSSGAPRVSLPTAVKVSSAVRAPTPEKVTAGFCALYPLVVVSRVTPVLAAPDASATV